MLFTFLFAIFFITPLDILFRILCVRPFNVLFAALLTALLTVLFTAALIIYYLNPMTLYNSVRHYMHKIAWEVIGSPAADTIHKFLSFRITQAVHMCIPMAMETHVHEPGFVVAARAHAFIKEL